MSPGINRGCKARASPVDEGLNVIHVELLAVGIREERILVASRTPGRILHTSALLRGAIHERPTFRYVSPGSEGAAGMPWLRPTPLQASMAEHIFHCGKHEQIHPSHLLTYYARSCSSQFWECKMPTKTGIAVDRRGGAPAARHPSSSNSR